MSKKLQLPQAPPFPQVPVPEGIPPPLREMGYTGQRLAGQAQRSVNGVLQGGNPVVEVISGIQSAMQSVPLPVELIAQFRRALRDARFPFAEFPPPPGMEQAQPGTPTDELAAGDVDDPNAFPIFS